jgi:uncharacterized protein YkwD
MGTPVKSTCSKATAGRRALVPAMAALALAAGASPANAQVCHGADAHPEAASRDALNSATLCLINRTRKARGRRAVSANRRLALAAERHAFDMVRRSYFSHDSPSGADFVDRIRRTGYMRGSRGWSLGENLAWGSQHLGTPRSIVAAWMRSPGHRANLLRRGFKEIGVGVAPGAPEPIHPNAATFVTEYGTRR